MSTLLTEFCFFSVNTVVLERKYEAHCIYSFICVLLLFFFFLCLKLNTCLAFSPAYCSDVFLFPRPCGSMECATKEISEMTQNRCPRLSVCLNNTPSYWGSWTRSWKHTQLSELSFTDAAVKLSQLFTKTADWRNYWRGTRSEEEEPE